LGVGNLVNIAVGIKRILEEEGSPDRTNTSFDEEQVIEIFEEGVPQL
jgi:hypothetical protein